MYKYRIYSPTKMIGSLLITGSCDPTSLHKTIRSSMIALQDAEQIDDTCWIGSFNSRQDSSPQTLDGPYEISKIRQPNEIPSLTNAALTLVVSAGDLVTPGFISKALRTFENCDRPEETIWHPEWSYSFVPHFESSIGDMRHHPESAQLESTLTPWDNPWDGPLLVPNGLLRTCELNGDTSEPPSSSILLNRLQVQSSAKIEIKAAAETIAFLQRSNITTPTPEPIPISIPRNRLWDKITLRAKKIAGRRLREFLQSKLIGKNKPNPNNESKLQQKLNIESTPIHADWKLIHEIEASLFPPYEPVPYTEAKPKNAALTTELDAILDVACGPYDAVFLVPWLIKAGADLEVLNYVRAMAEANPSSRLLVIADRDHPSEWADRLPETADFLRFGTLCRSLGRDQKVEVLTKLLLQLSPRVIHNINSEIGYLAMIHHGGSLSAVSHLYSLVFCSDQEPAGRWVNYTYHHLPFCFEHLSGVFSDNLQVLEEIKDRFNFDPSKLFCHYQPIDYTKSKTTPSSRSWSQSRPLQILWAGRLDRQKRPDILADIARELLGEPVQFNVYGYTHLDPADQHIHGIANIKFHGAYNGFESLPIRSSDLFLYTSQWDGLPNVILEAMAHGLPVIASDSGGISELVHTDDSGALVSPYDEPQKYVQAIRRILRSPEILNTTVEGAHKLLKRRHSWSEFTKNVSEVPNYFSPRSEKKLQLSRLASLRAAVTSRFAS